MQNKKLVSLIVAVYDVEKYLQKCIDSICLQSYSQLEIILVDDGSSDDCGRICDNNAIYDSRIKVIHKANGGLSSARNAGLDVATGEYVVFVDADDRIHPKYVEILVRLCEQYNCDVAQCDFLTVAEDSLLLSLNPQQYINIYDNRQILHELCSVGDDYKYSIAWNKVYRRSLFAEIRYPEGRIHEDEFTTYLVLWKAKEVVVTNQYLYYYLQRPTSIIGKPFSLKRLDAIDAFVERLCFLKKNGLEEEYFATLYKTLGLIENCYALVKENIRDNEEICEKLLEKRVEIIEQIPIITEKRENAYIDYDQLNKDCFFSEESEIILYGAGYWGHVYYRWIHENRRGKIVGWVDNKWCWYKGTFKEATIMPLDLLIRISYDYVLITIANKYVQEEIKNNLVSWGISKDKIFSIKHND